MAVSLSVCSMLPEEDAVLLMAEITTVSVCVSVRDSHVYPKDSVVARTRYLDLHFERKMMKKQMAILISSDIIY